MKDGHMGGRNGKFSQRCGRKTSTKGRHISKLKDNIARSYTPRFLVYVSDRKTSKYWLTISLSNSVQNFKNIPSPTEYQTLNLANKISNFHTHAVYLVVTME